MNYKYMGKRAKAPNSPFTLPELAIFTDGSCWPNPGPGGYGYVAVRNGVEVAHEYGAVAGTTNNRMEMLGVLAALNYAAQSRGDWTIFSDSQYVVKGMTTWRRGWERKGYMRGDHLMLNHDMWRMLHEGHDLTGTRIEWVRGHNGNRWNERADEIAGGKCRCGACANTA